jgi:DNA polymerase I
MEEEINSAYDEFAQNQLNAEEHRFQIEFEKLFKMFFQAGTKKRYAGHIIWKEGKDVDSIDITGFEYQRSDVPGITKVTQKGVIKRIVHGEDNDTIQNFLKKKIAKVKEGEVSIDQLGIPGGINQSFEEYDTETAHVRGAKYANTVLDTNFGKGSKPKRLYLSRIESSFFSRIEQQEGITPQENEVYREFKRDPDVIGFVRESQIPNEFEIDYEKMYDKTIDSPIRPIVEAIGISIEATENGQTQTGLGQFN